MIFGHSMKQAAGIAAIALATFIVAKKVPFISKYL
jgi:hypothetical protein